MNPDVTGVVVEHDQTLACGVTEFGTLLPPVDHAHIADS